MAEEREVLKERYQNFDGSQKERIQNARERS